MATRSMADAVRAILVKRAFVPGAAMGGDPAAMGGMPPGDPAAMGGDPAAMGGMPPGDPAAMGGDPAAMGGMPPGDPAAMGGMPPGGDPMAGMPPVDPSMMGLPPAPGGQSGMINMTADEFTKFIKQMMAAFGAAGAPQQAAPAQDIGAKLDTLIAVMQAKGAQPPVM